MNERDGRRRPGKEGKEGGRERGADLGGVEGITEAAIEGVEGGDIPVVEIVGSQVRPAAEPAPALR